MQKEISKKNNNNTKFEIELINVTKKFSDVIAVNNLSLGIKEGEFFSLLGPSGCGKTTALRMIAGLEEPTSGEIFLSNKNVTNIPAHFRNVNTVFQDYAIFPHMNITDNIYFPLRMRKIPKKQALPKIEHILRLVNMEGFGNRYSSQLSGGQRQRIALARALVNEPRALLLDEPLGSLDFKLRIAMQTVLKDIQNNINITFVYVTHDQTEALSMSDRIAVMKDGVIHQISTPDDIYNKPKTAYVASFIGNMNFLEGKIIKDKDDSLVIKVAEEFEVTSKKCEFGFSEGDKVLFCIRPERILINSNKKLKNEVMLKFERIIFKGNEVEITATFKNIILNSIVEYKKWDSSLSLGNNLRLSWDKEDTIVFPINMKKDVIKY